MEFIDKHTILSLVDELEIYQKYFGNFRLSKLYKSPFRDNDNTPSFNIFAKSRGNSICKYYYKDLGDVFEGDVFQFVCDYFGISFKEALNKIAQDFNLPVETGDPRDYSKLERAKRIDRFCNIEVVIQDYTKYDKDYWHQASDKITGKMLREADIYSLHKVYVNDFFNAESNPKYPIYGYRVNGRWRIYKPYEKDKKKKWISNLVEGDIQGFAQLPDKGELLIIASSRKDAFILQLLGFAAIAPLGENINFNKWTIDYLYTRFDNIIRFFDNDERGILFAENFHKEDGIPYIYFPVNYPKDPFAFMCMYGYDETEAAVNGLIYGGYTFETEDKEEYDEEYQEDDNEVPF